MFDLLIKNATIVDGTGNAETPVADVAIRDGRIVAMDPKIDADARRVIDARGLALAPGFIDIHSHSDIGLLEDPRADIKVRQGVTLEVVGNCGSSLVPLDHGSKELVLRNVFTDVDPGNQAINWRSFAEFSLAMERAGISINAMALVGHGTLRIAAMGLADSAPDTRQMDRMKQLLAEAIEEGACGLSTGLIYAPGCFAHTEELIRLCGVLNQKGGFYASHMRNEAEGILDAHPHRPGR